MAQERKQDILAAGLESRGFKELQVATSAKYRVFGPRTSVGFLFITKNGTLRVGRVWSDTRPAPGLEHQAYTNGLRALGKKEPSTTVQDILAMVL